MCLFYQAMLPDRHFFAESQRKQVGPRSPWFFRGLLLFAILLVAAVTQVLEPGGIWHHAIALR